MLVEGDKRSPRVRGVLGARESLPPAERANGDMIMLERPTAQRHSPLAYHRHRS